jgi:hypothetical protein
MKDYRLLDGEVLPLNESAIREMVKKADEIMPTFGICEIFETKPSLFS